MTAATVEGERAPGDARTNARTIGPLTGLRLFAALYVLIHHSGSGAIAAAGAPAVVNNFLWGGQMGVSFFFVLSGFILTYTYQATAWNRRTVGDFGWARFARIVPVYMLSLLIVLPLYAPVASWRWTLGTLFMVQSWVPASQLDGEVWNALAWTLSCEALFYLCLPFLLIATRRWSRTVLLGTLAATWLLIVVLQLPTGPPVAELSDYGANPALLPVPIAVLRIPEFFSGILLARLCFQHGRALSETWLVLSVGVTAGLLALPFDGYGYSCAAIGFGAIIYSTTSSTGGVLTKALGSKSMLLMGGASYGIYIFQGVIQQWMDEFVGGGNIGGILAWPVIIGFSIAVFLWFEEPTRSRLKGWRRRRLEAPAPIATETMDRGLS